MRVNATRIIIQSAATDSLWYASKLNQLFWADNVGGDFPWKIIQEGSKLSVPLYIRKDDARPLREALVEVEWFQTVREIT